MAQTPRALRAFTNSLDRSIRINVIRRYEAMIRELQYLREIDKDDLKFIASRGWSDERLRVVFLLNSVYQLCVGPIYASSPVSKRIGGSIPLHYGEQVFDLRRSQAVRRFAYNYSEMASKLGISAELLTQNTCGDVIYRIARNEQEEAES